MSSLKPLVRRYIYISFLAFIIVSLVNTRYHYISELPLLSDGYYNKIIIYPGGYCSIKSTYNITFLFGNINIKILKHYVVEDYNITGLVYYYYKILNVNPTDKVILEFKSKVYIYDFNGVKKFYDVLALVKYVTLAITISLIIIYKFFLGDTEYLTYEELDKY